MDENICVLVAPSSFLTVILNDSTQGVCPKGEMSMELYQGRHCIPFDSTLLPTALPTHLCADLTPENIVVHVLALRNCHLSDDAR